MWEISKVWNCEKHCRENSSGNGLQIFHWLLTFPAETTQRIHWRGTFSREKNTECNPKKQILWLHHLLHSLERHSPQLERHEKGLNPAWSSGAKYRISQLQEVTGRQSERMRIGCNCSDMKESFTFLQHCTFVSPLQNTRTHHIDHEMNKER